MQGFGGRVIAGLEQLQVDLVALVRQLQTSHTTGSCELIHSTQLVLGIFGRGHDSTPIRGEIVDDIICNHTAIQVNHKKEGRIEIPPSRQTMIAGFTSEP